VALYGDRRSWMISVGAVINARAIPGVPYFVLLDSHG
jgi:hypothetical protein